MGDMASMYRGGKLAILGNVGPLRTPLTREQYNSGNQDLRVPGLYSHNDQQTLWQSGRTNIDSGGWAGRFVETMNKSGFVASSPFLSINTAAQSSNFGNGDSLPTYALTPNTDGAIQIGLARDANDLVFNAALRSKLVTLARGEAGGALTNMLEADYAKVVKSSDEARKLLAARLPGLSMASVTRPAGIPGYGTPMLDELDVIARMIKYNVSNNIAGRQVFFVRHDGFDTHGPQLEAHARLLKQLNDAMFYFQSVLEANTMSNNVTTFTASEFGRQLANNGDGTDHGWGAHHFIMGSAVQGGQIYGRVPSYLRDNLGNYLDPNMVEASGVMLPQVSVDQYSATLGTWLGMRSDDLKQVLPYHFGTTNLGFMKA
jgi:uncharacterized protein (DUF1501 family)